MVLNQYYDMAFLMNLDLETVNILFVEAVNKKTEDIIFSLWEKLYPFMFCGFFDFIGFEDFKNKIFEKGHTSDLSNEEILMKFASIVEEDKKRQVINDGNI